MTLFWIVLIIIIVWVLNGKKQRLSPERESSISTIITEESIFDAQLKFEERIKIDLPDSISRQEKYIFQNLMRMWYDKLVSKNRYDASMIQKLRHDWLVYMWALDEKSSCIYLHMENYDENEKSDEYYKSAALASRKIIAIEDGFAAAIGMDAVNDLARIRAMDGFSAFSRTGELAPEGCKYNADDKIERLAKDL